jgi:hypothetical protein
MRESDEKTVTGVDLFGQPASGPERVEPDSETIVWGFGCVNFKGKRGIEERKGVVGIGLNSKIPRGISRCVGLAFQSTIRSFDGSPDTSFGLGLFSSRCEI